MVMQAKALMICAVAVLAVAGSPLFADDRGRPERGDPEGRGHGGPNMIIEPNIDLSRRDRPNVDSPQFIMDEIGTCARAGMRSFVDCLQANHSSVMIRRLQACVRSETIPDEPERVAACLPPGPVR